MENLNALQYFQDTVVLRHCFKNSTIKKYPSASSSVAKTYFMPLQRTAYNLEDTCTAVFSFHFLPCFLSSCVFASATSAFPVFATKRKSKEWQHCGAIVCECARDCCASFLIVEMGREREMNATSLAACAGLCFSS